MYLQSLDFIILTDCLYRQPNSPGVVHFHLAAPAFFPPAQQPRKIDLQIESGEYFLGKRDKEKKQLQEKREKQEQVSEERKRERSKDFEAPEEEAYENKLVKKDKKDKKEKKHKKHKKD